MKILARILAGALALIAVPVQAVILLNEVHFRTPLSSDFIPNDGNFEFIELKNTTRGVEPCTGLWILIIGNDEGGTGEVKKAWQLKNVDGADMTTGANGLLLLGDDYTRPNSPYQLIKEPQTTMDDPGMDPDDLPDTQAFSVLLVRDYTNPLPLPGTARVDLDMDNDGTGVFDWDDTTPPALRYATPLWSAIVDSVGWNGDQGTIIKFAYSPANLSRSNVVIGVPQAGSVTVNFLPHSIARNSTVNTANSPTAWYGGKVAGASADSVTYATSYFNLLPGATWRGLVTPGQPNFSSAPVAPAFRINEINVHPPGLPGKSPDPNNPAQYRADDGNFEYIEIINTVANQAGSSNYFGSLNGYSILMVGSGGVQAGLGTIRKAWRLNQFFTGINGLLVLGDDYEDGNSPFAGNMDIGAQVGDPDDGFDETVNPPALMFNKLSRGDLSNNGVTYLLVSAYPGLNVKNDIDSDNDGVIDAPATLGFTIVDGVSIPEVDPNNNLVPNHGGYSPAQPDIFVGGKHYNADNLSRIRNLNTASSTAVWSAGVFGSKDPYALAYRNGFNITGTAPAFRSAASPGKPNYNSTNLPAAGTVLLNEVHLNPPTAADETEFVELISTTPHALMTNLWLIFLDATPSGSGVVKKVIDLRGQSTGGNRLAVFADGIEEAGHPLFPFHSAQTLRDDPASFNADGTQNSAFGFNLTPGGLVPNDGLSILLVAYTPATATGVPVTPGTDLDAGNDGTLDAAPAWALVDGISTGNGVGGVPVILTSGNSPGNLSRYVGNTTADSSEAWFGGELTGGSAISFDYSNNFFGAFKGAASPGRHNVIATPNSAQTLLLNEININPPGGDNDREFIELRSGNNAAISTNGYTLLLVDNEGTDTGKVLKAWDLDGAATGSNGLLLTGVGYAPGNVPWTGGDGPAPETTYFSPDTMAFDDIGRNTDNGALTILLVKNFKGRVGDDLDQGTQGNLTLPDDHTFEFPVPWDSQADSVAMQGFVAGNPDDGIPAHLDGFIFPGTANLTLPLSANAYTPDTVARFGGNSTANSSAAWYGAKIFGTAATSTVYEPSQFFPASLHDGKITPGQVNLFALTDDSDTDGDGVVYLMELALGMDPYKADNHKLPQLAMTTVDNVTQPSFRVSRPTGGTPGISYIVQASLDLQTWNLPTTLSSTLPSTPGAGMETQIYLVHPDFLPLLDLRRRLYFRLKVQR